MLNLSKEVIKAMEKRRMYSGEFKADAVSLTLKNEKTVKETAEDLSIPYSILCNMENSIQQIRRRCISGQWKYKRK